MKINQKGFGAIEALLFLILLSILGFTGYYVWHSQSNVNSTYDRAAKTSSNTPATSSSSSSKFVFKEIGVQINLPAALDGLSYQAMDLGSTTALELTTPHFTELANICWAHDPVSFHAFQTIIKKTGKYGSDGYIGTNLKQFGGYYIGGNTLPSFDCEDTSNQQRVAEFRQLGADLNSALNSAFKTATEVK